MAGGTEDIVGGRPPSASGFKKYAVGVIPILALVAFFSYLWFVSGVLPFVENYPKGQIKTEGYVKRTGFSEYRRQGHWVTYHANGQRASEGFYEAGEKVGLWTYWDEDGRELPGEPEGHDSVEP